MGGIKRIAVSVVGAIAITAAICGIVSLAAHGPDWFGPVLFLLSVTGILACAIYRLLGA